MERFERHLGIVLTLVCCAGLANAQQFTGTISETINGFPAQAPNFYKTPAGSGVTGTFSIDGAQLSLDANESSPEDSLFSGSPTAGSIVLRDATGSVTIAGITSAQLASDLKAANFGASATLDDGSQVEGYATIAVSCGLNGSGNSVQTFTSFRLSDLLPLVIPNPPIPNSSCGGYILVNIDSLGIDYEMEISLRSILVPTFPPPPPPAPPAPSPPPKPNQPLSAGCLQALATAKGNPQGVQRAIEQWPTLQIAAATSNIDPSLLAAIAIRETDFRDVRQYGDNNNGSHGEGVFQITVPENITSQQAKDLSSAASYAAALLAHNRDLFRTDFPEFTPTQLLQAMAAGYNMSPDNIWGDPNQIDAGTTGGNYGSNVVALMSCFQ